MEQDLAVLDAALKYLKRGWSVIPIAPRDKKPLPGFGWKEFQTRFPTELEVRAWFTDHPDANIAIVTGEISGLVVIDCDGPEADAALGELIGHCPSTPTSGTGRGRHRFFAHPGVKVRNAVKLLEKVDVRGDGGYVVAAPSVHGCGKQYAWSDEYGCGFTAPLAQLPVELRKRVVGNSAAQAASSEWSKQVTDAELEEQIPEGARDSRLTRYAGSYFAHGMSSDDVLTNLRTINRDRCSPPLEDAEVVRIVASIGAREALVANVDRKAARRRAVGILEELSEVQPLEMKWLWHGYIPFGGLTVIDGVPGIGKSTLTLDLAARVSTGREMPDGSPGVEGHVLMLAIEDSLAMTVAPRAIAAGGNVDRITVLKEVQDGSDRRALTLPADMQVIRSVVERKETKLIVIDPLMAFIQREVNTYSDQHVRGLLAEIALLAEERDVAVVLVRHPTKNREASAMEAGGGSVGIIAAARAGFYVARHPEHEGQVVLAPTKQNLTRQTTALAFEVVSADSNDKMPRISWLGASSLSAEDLRPQHVNKPSRMDQACEFLLDFLKDGGRPANEVKKAASAKGITGATLKRAADRLEIKAVKTDFTGGWRWSLSEESESNERENRSNVIPFDPSRASSYQSGGGAQQEAQDTKEIISLDHADRCEDGTDGAPQAQHVA